MTTPAAPAAKITRDDLEAKFAGLQGGATDKVLDARQKIVTAVVAGGVLMLVVAFLLGRRKGRRQTTIVEIRRV